MENFTAPRFEESKDGPFNWYIRNLGIKKKFFTFLFENFLERVLSFKLNYVCNFFTMESSELKYLI
jgi:phage regulator Rha-like protein